MTIREAQEVLSEMYGVEISAYLISKTADRVLPRLEE